MILLQVVYWAFFKNYFDNLPNYSNGMRLNREADGIDVVVFAPAFLQSFLQREISTEKIDGPIEVELR